jgi:hypothetical protein
MTWSQVALNGCEDAYRVTRNPSKTAVTASSVAGQHCCGPGCHDVDVHLPDASQPPTPPRSLLGWAISHRSQDLVRGSLLPGYAANGDRSAASTVPVPAEVDLGCSPCPGGPVHRTAPPCCSAVTARLSTRSAPPAWCADTSPGLLSSGKLDMALAVAQWHDRSRVLLLYLWHTSPRPPQTAYSGHERPQHVRPDYQVSPAETLVSERGSITRGWEEDFPGLKG